MNVTELSAIDVHVHLEAPAGGTAADAAAAKYFGDSGAARDGAALVDYYRSRKMACVLFAVDERLSGRPRVSNEAVVELAEANPDVIIPFASIDPTRGPAAVQEAKRLVADRRVRGLKLHPPLQQFSPDDRIAYWDTFGWPEKKPGFLRGIPETWWYDADKATKLERAR